MERRSRDVIACKCGKNSNEEVVPLADKWYHLFIKDLKSYSIVGIIPGELADLKKDSMQRKFLIDASRCEEALVYTLGIIDVQDIIIAKECLDCA